MPGITCPTCSQPTNTGFIIGTACAARIGDAGTWEPGCGACDRSFDIATINCAKAMFGRRPKTAEEMVADMEQFIEDEDEEETPNG